MPKEDVLSELPQFMSEMRGFAAEVRLFINDQVQFNDFLRENVVLKDDLKEELKNFVTKDEFNSLCEKVGSIGNQVDSIHNQVDFLDDQTGSLAGTVNSLSGEIGSLRDDVRAIDERTKWIETDVKFLKRTRLKISMPWGRTSSS